MSTADRFKFIKEIELTGSQQSQQDKLNNQDSKLGVINQFDYTFTQKLVYCHFSGIKEQTQNEVEKLTKDFSESSQLYQTSKRDQRCYFKDENVRVYSRGGSEYIIPLHFKVKDVFPIEDGLIIKTVFNRDMIYFDPMTIRGNNLGLQAQEYSYMTITEHPLNDIHPLSFGGKSDLIQTHIDILYVSYKIPFVVLYNNQTYQLIFGLIKNKSNLNNGYEEPENYIKTIEPMSRNPQLYNISKDFQLWIDEIFTIPSPSPPSFISLSKGLVNPYELVVALFYQNQKKLDFFRCDIRQPKEWKNISGLNNIQDVNKINFSRQKSQSEDSIKIISKKIAKTLQGQVDGNAQNMDLQMMKKRIKQLNKDLILCDTQGRTLQIYSGYVQVYTIEIYQHIENQLSIQDRNMISKTSKVDRLLEASNSNITLQFSNGFQKRFQFRFQINDFIINSILKALKQILPSQIYETLYQDTIETLAKCNNDPNTQQDQFTKFQNLIMQILSGEQYQVSQTNKIQSIASLNSNQQLFSQASTQPATQQLSQQIQQQQPQKPIQTLQTKILRSSTTSQGIDSLANRRKAAGSGLGAQSQIQTKQSASKPTSTQMVTRQSVVQGGTVQSKQLQQARRVTSGSIESIQPISFTAQPSSQFLSSNPFQELLNSNFHKDNFSTKYASLFPAGFVIQPPQVITAAQQEVLEKPTQVSVSPTKSNVIKPISQKVTSTKQSNTFSQQSSTSHERRNSNVFTPQQQVQQNQPLTISVQLQTFHRTSKQDLEPFIGAVFEILHLMYEDLKLNKLRDPIERPKLARLLIKLALMIDPIKKAAFIEYYVKDLGKVREDIEEEIKKAYKEANILKAGIDLEPVPQIYKWLELSLKRQQSIMNFAYPLYFERTRKIIRLYELLNGSNCNSQLLPLLISSSSVQLRIDHDSLQDLNFKKSSTISLIYPRDYLMQDTLRDLHPFEKILFCLKDENLNLDELKKLPSIVALPILEIIRYARLFQQEIQSVPVWPDSLYKLIQREDILNNLRLFERKNNNFGKHQSTIVNEQGETILNQVQRQASKKFALNRGLTNVFADNTVEEIKQAEHRKEMESNIIRTTADLIYQQSNTAVGFDSSHQNTSIIDFFRNRFSQDTRLKEVQNMLNSSSEIIVKLEHIPNRDSLSEEAFNTEKQKLLDKLFSRHLAKCTGRGALTFGTMQTIPTEVLHIPKINQTGYAPMNETYMQVEFKDDGAGKEMLQWPEFHNGVASALRIAQSFVKKMDGGVNQQQHTRNWIMYHKPQEPKYEHGGFLLAIGLLGQLDTLQPTDIYQHLKSTHDATAIGMLLGRAASKIGTMDDHDTRTLCIHIPYLLPPTLSIDISLSIQSAAVVGAGLLYKGTSNRLMTEMLLAQIGRKPLSDKAIEREGYALASGLALGLVNLGIGNKMQGLSDLKLDERLIRYVEGGKIIDLPQSMLSQNFNHENTQKQGQGCSSIKEGDMVNVHITSQGALVALALIHLKSNNYQIVQQLQMPQTFFSLESVRPSFLLIKTLCRNLIMWDGIKCSKEWVLSQIPQVIREIYENDITTVEKKFQQKSVIEDGIDYSTVALCYVNIVAGALFSIGFKYVGTGNRQAFQLIHEQTQHFFRKLKIVQSNKDSIGMIHNNLTKNQVDKNTVETCLCVCAFAMSMIMAGTGDIECFRALRILRKRFEHDMHYGYNMAINMSLGFLFLGTGAFTFSRNDLAIASLLCSLYPVFPQNPGDNRYHLQALRHFYVLAVETRLLQARDIDSGHFLSLEMSVTVEETDQSANGQGQIKITTQKILTPDIINGQIKSIEINNDQYHSVNIDLIGNVTSNADQEMQMESDQLNSNSNTMNGSLRKQKVFEQFGFQKIIYVKKKASALVEEIAQQKGTKASTDLLESDCSHIVDNLIIQDPNSRQLIEETPKLMQKIYQIRDPTIEAFHKSFASLDHFYSGQASNLADIEDILLAQNKDHFAQLSPQEFFKIQDSYDQIRECYDYQILPSNLKTKLSILRGIHDAYYNDKLELIKVIMQMINHKENGIMMEDIRLFNSYIKFRDNQKNLSKINGQDGLILEGTTDQLDIKSVQSHIISLVDNYSQEIIKGKKYDTQAFDIYSIQVAKVISDQILGSLIQQGEIDLVNKYREKKINGDNLEDGPLIEINESIRMSIQHLFGDQDNSMETQFIDKVLIPSLMKI